MAVAALPYLDLTAPGFSTRSDAVLAARAAGPLARTPFGFAILRHREAGQALRDRRLRQGSHDWPRKVGLIGAFADFWMRSIISREGPDHKRLRQIAQAALAEPHILALCPTFEACAAELLAALPEEVEFVHDFTEPFAGRAITALLGLPTVDAPALARDASTLGLAMGLDARTHEQAVNAAAQRLDKLAATLIARATPDPEAPDFTGRLLHAATSLGARDEQALRDLVVISIFGGVDTTRAQLAFAAGLFADHPAHWTRLRTEPDHIQDALAEVIRTRPTTTWATRETIEAIEFAGITIPAGTTIHILVHATSTDPAVDDGTFDPFRPAKLHFGFGGGAHHCLGHFVARTDMECALRVLLRQVARIERTGPPDDLPDSGNTSPRALPLRLVRG